MSLWIIRADADAFGPYNDDELRAALIEEFISNSMDEDHAPDEDELAEWRGMDLDALIEEFTDLYYDIGGGVLQLNDPGDEWRRSVKEAGR